MADEKKGRKTRKRRGRGEGSIHERADGRWSAILDLGAGPDGKRRRRYVYGKTKTEAKNKLLALQRKHHAGEAVDPSRLTVGQYLDDWLARNRWEPSTTESYKRMARLHLKPRIGHVLLQRLTVDDVRFLYRDMEAAGLSGRMRQYAHSILRHALADAHRSRLVAGNVCDALTKKEKPKPRPPEVRPLTADEVRRLLKAAEGDPLHAFYVLAVTTGLREGESAALRWSDVELDAARLRVRRKVIEVEGEFHVGVPKGKQGRAVPLPAMAVEALRRHRKRLDAAGYSGELVFPAADGGFLRRRSLSRHLRGLLDAAGLPRVRVHDLRHSHASLLLQQNVHPKVVAERLGHATIAVTMNVYSHVVEGLQEAAAEKIGDVLAGPTRGRKRKPKP